MLPINKERRICIAGHIGVGHLFSHSGFVQDDSLGFLAVVGFVRELFGLKIELEEIRADKDKIEVLTSHGGVGVGRPRRGLTPFEAYALKRAGVNPLFIQRSALEVFGEFYGNGVSEVAVSFMYALAESILEALKNAVPGSVMFKSSDDVCSDIVWGVNLDFNGVPLTLVATVNGSRAGLGPCEDLEGNVYRGIKLRLLKKLRALKTPTIVVESKAFNPAIEISQRSFLVRYNKEVDNSTVASSLCKALEELSFPFLCLDTAFPLLDKPAIEVEVERFLKHLLNLAKALSKSKTSRKRALLLGELAKLVSEDAGGIVFMSSQINRVARAVGLMPGTGAVISMCLPKAYIEEYRIPFVDERDVDETVLILRKATLRLWEGIEDAQRELNLKFRRFRKG